MTELQRTLYSNSFIPSVKKTNGDILRGLSDESLESSMHACQIVWMRKPEVIAFIASIPFIKNEHEAQEEYADHLIACGAFESIARITRSTKEDRKTGKTKAIIKRRKSPSWYSLYLQTAHWLETKQRVLNHYSSLCVLCDAEGIIGHHKHYKTLGSECVKRDISLLCENCHCKAHDWLSIKVPRLATVEAMSVLEREGTCHGRHKP